VTTGVWLYPWDVRDIPDLPALLSDSQVDTVCLPGSYHSLRAAVPGNATRRVFELSGTAAYFAPDEMLWRDQLLRPTTSPLVADLGDVFDYGRRLADQAGASLTGWLVCLHADKLVRHRPELAVELATGDIALGAPCLLAAEVRDYAVRLARDVSGRVDALQLESLHWVAQPHARHTKIDGAAPKLSRLATSVCFCQRCREFARGRGVDADLVAKSLLATWSSALDGLSPDDPDDVDGLGPYLELRAEVVTGLLAEIVAAVNVPVEVVRFGDAVLNGVNTRAIEELGVVVRVLGYGSADRVARGLAELKAAPDSPGELHVGVSLLSEHVTDLADAQGAIQAAVVSGAESMRLYHLGLAGARRRAWLPSLLDTWRTERTNSS